MHKTFAEQKKQHESDLKALGAQRTKRLKERATEILTELSRSFDIHGLVMGMGAWLITGGKFTAEYDDGGESEMEVSELKGWIDSGGRKWWHPKGIKDADRLLLSELNDLLCYVTDPDNRYIGTFDIKLNR